MTLSQNTVVRDLASSDESADWRDKAACLGEDPELFYADKPDKAMSICGRCTVRPECLADALRWGAQDQHGIAGGLTEDERKALKPNTYHRRPATTGEGRNVPDLTDADRQRYWSKIRVQGDCWLWGSFTDKGHGRFEVYRNGTVHGVSARRVAYLLVTGDQPPPVVEGHCGRVTCCRPAAAVDVEIGAAA